MLGWTGLPEEWIPYLKANNITQDMAIKNKDAIADCLTLLNDPYRPMPLPNAEEWDREMDKGRSACQYP